MNRPLACLALALVATLAAAGCSRAPATPEERLVQSLEQAYAPLQTCVAGKVEAVGIERLATELAASPGFDEFTRDAQRILRQSPAPGEQAEPSKQAQALLAGLREPGTGEAGDPVAMRRQDLVRRVVGDSALSALPSVQCAVSDELTQLTAEARAAGHLAAVTTAYLPYEACVVAALANRQDFNGLLPEMIQEAGLDGTLQDASRRYLGHSIDLGPLGPESRLAATRKAFQELGAYGAELGRGPEKTFGDMVRRRMSMVEVMQAMAMATSVSCQPTETLLSSMEVAHDEYF